jgi:hypothetical protein
VTGVVEALMVEEHQVVGKERKFMFKLGEDWKKDLSLLVYSALLWGVTLHFLFKYGVADKSWLVSIVFSVLIFISLVMALGSVVRGIRASNVNILTLLGQLSSFSLLIFLIAVYLGGVETTETRQVVETREFNGYVSSRNYDRGLHSVNFTIEGEDNVLTLDNVEMKVTFTEGTPVHHINTVAIEEIRKDWFNHTKSYVRNINLVVD